MQGSVNITNLKGIIENNTDLNNILIPGKYRLINENFTLLNKPNIDLGVFNMEVEVLKTNTEKYYVLQKILTSNSDIIIRKILVDGDTKTYSEWKINGEILITKVLTAGSTSITFNSKEIKSTSTISVYTDVYTISPLNVTIDNNNVTATFIAQSKNINVILSIK